MLLDRDLFFVLLYIQTMLGEFLSANVSTPFLLFMVKGMTCRFLLSANITPSTLWGIQGWCCGSVLDGYFRWVIVLNWKMFRQQAISFYVLHDPISHLATLGMRFGNLNRAYHWFAKITQATVAEKHGRRAVLMVSLLGSALTCLSFGTSTTLQQAICLRLLQGIFAGAVGVARGSVAFVTDSTNEGRAYAILGCVCCPLNGI